MPAFTLYGAVGSTNTDRVRLTLAEAGFTDYDLVLLDLMKGEQKSPAHLARNPNGKVPVLVCDDGFTLYESRAICKYLTKKYNFKLAPSETDLKTSALFDQAQSMETIYFTEPAGRVGFELVVKKFLGIPVDQAAVQSSMKAVETFLDIAEQTLTEHEYMAGQFSLVDIYYVPVIKRLIACGFAADMFKREHVKAWWERVSTRPAIESLSLAGKR